MFTIYIATCSENNKVYIGQTHTFLSKRRWAHINRADYDDFFHRALRKYGAHKFQWEVLAKVPSKQEANNLERLWIILLQSRNRQFGYNIPAGGDGSFGYHRSEETRRRHSISLKRAWANGTKKAGRGWKRHHSLETREKISATLRARPKSPQKFCGVPECLRPIHSQGFCGARSHRLRRYGNPTAGNPIGTHGPAKGTKYNRKPRPTT